MLCVEPVVRMISEDIIRQDIRSQDSVTKFSTQALLLLFETFFGVWKDGNADRTRCQS